MKRYSTSPIAAGAIILAWMACLQDVLGTTRNLALPNYVANPGTFIEVPLTINNASGLAAIRTQINFDPNVLELVDVNSGKLGDAFELTKGNGDGFVKLVFARAEELASGSGQLATLKFKVNSGAVQEFYSELTVADVGLSDKSGVVDLCQKDVLSIKDGSIIITLNPNIDNEHNVLPDWWEELHGMSLFGQNASLDDDHDGLPNLLEYAFGANPHFSDKHQREPQGRVVDVGGQQFLTLDFLRRTGDASLTFHLQQSADLVHWTELSLPAQMVGIPQDMGDGTEFVRARGTIPVMGGNAQNQCFLRLQIERN